MVIVCRSEVEIRQCHVYQMKTDANYTTLMQQLTKMIRHELCVCVCALNTLIIYKHILTE